MRHLIALISDTHFGSTVALCGKSFARDDGGSYEASPAQLWLHRNWQEYWNWVEAYKRKRDRLIVTHVGDVCDGTDHHGNTQAVSSNPNDEIRLSIELLQRPRQLADALYFIRGTASHVGEASWREEAIARQLGAVKDGEQRFTHDILKLNVQGREIHFAHHGNVGRHRRLRNNAARIAAEQHIINAIHLGRKPADLLVRGHAHRKADSGTDFITRVIQLPAWQLKTGFVNRIAPDEYDIADIGGALLIIEDGEIDIKWKIFTPDEKPVLQVA